MQLNKPIVILVLLFSIIGVGNSQVIGFRLAANSGMYINELGDSDVPHPDALQQTPAISTQNFKMQPTIGVEGEILFQVSPMSHFGVELEYSKLKGYNETPPIYNYYLTPYYADYQKYYTADPVAFNTTLINVAVNWKYFFFKQSPLKPFVKLTGVVAFVGTDFTFNEEPNPEFFESNVLYSRGTSNSEQEKLPAFHLGGGIGFDYKLSDHWSIQADITSTVINSDIINGVPNFTYEKVDDKEMLLYNKRPSLTAQISAGLVYTIEISKPGGSSGKTDTSLPFYRRK